MSNSDDDVLKILDDLDNLLLQKTNQAVDGLKKEIDTEIKKTGKQLEEIILKLKQNS
jgi:hypothetical protein